MVQGGGGGPGAVGVHQVLGGGGAVVVGELGIAVLSQNGVGVLHGVLGTHLGLRVVLLALEHNIGDDAVAVEVHRVVVLHQVVADQLALHVAGLSGVGAHEGSQLIAVDHIVGDLAVEEDHGDAGGLGGVHDALGGLVSGGLHRVDHQHIGAVGDGGVDLVHLSALVGVAVVVAGGDADGLELGVHLVADVADEGVGVVVVEDGHVQVAGSGGAGLGGSAGLSGRGGGGGGLAAAGAGGNAQTHGPGQKQGRQFLEFHVKSSLFLFQ